MKVGKHYSTDIEQANLNLLRNIVTIIKSRVMRWTEHAARMWKRVQNCKI
jgi:hypothetical protein